MQSVNTAMLNFSDEFTGTPENIKHYKQLLYDANSVAISLVTP